MAEKLKYFTSITSNGFTLLQTFIISGKRRTIHAVKCFYLLNDPTFKH